MDFSVIFQLRSKKFWWMDVILYFVTSLLVATIFCYVIFMIKNDKLRDEIGGEALKLQTVGTTQQKEQEKEVISYRNKINDFSGLLKNHEFASNAFAFLESQTMPNIWFRQISLDRRAGTIQLSGEADNMDAFSRQVTAFERSKYVKNLGSLNTSLGDSARASFSIYIELDKNIFSYIASVSSDFDTESSKKKASEKENEEPSDDNAIQNLLKNKK